MMSCILESGEELIGKIPKAHLVTRPVCQIRSQIHSCHTGNPTLDSIPDYPSTNLKWRAEGYSQHWQSMKCICKYYVTQIQENQNYENSQILSINRVKLGNSNPTFVEFRDSDSDSNVCHLLVCHVIFISSEPMPHVENTLTFLFENSTWTNCIPNFQPPPKTMQFNKTFYTLLLKKLPT